MDQIRLASPIDPIARAQAGRVRALLEARPETLAVVEMVFESCQVPQEEAVCLSRRILEGEADAAVCPVDRLPLKLPEEITIGAFLRDKSAFYRCVSPRQPALQALPPESRVVVCDAVARAQILHHFPLLSVDLAPPSGGILEGLRGGSWDAACVPPELLEAGPLAGLQYAPIAAGEIVPRVGLGAVCVLVRSAPARRHDLVSQVDDHEVRTMLMAERCFLAHAAHDHDVVSSARATRTGDRIELTGLIADKEGRWIAQDTAMAAAKFVEVIAREVADSCSEMAKVKCAGAGRSRRAAS